MFDAAKNVDLVDCTLLQLLILPEFGNGDNFNRIFFLIRIIDGSVDFPVDPRADNFIERIVFDIFYHLFY